MVKNIGNHISEEKSIDRTCRNHGNCDWCKDNRIHAVKVQKEIADAKLAEYEEGGSG